MDRSAIEKIAETAVAAHSVIGTDFPVQALPQGSSIQSLEEFQDGRYRYRGIMKTPSMSDFCAYVGSHEHAQCFIDQDNMAATAFFNLGTVDMPGHGDHRASLKLKPTAPYSTMLAVNGIRLTQKAIAEFLEDNRDFLEAIDSDGGAMELKRAIASVRKISITANQQAGHEDRDFGASRSALEEIEAKAADGEALPRSFLFACEPYEGLNLRDFYMRLSLITGDEPRFILRIIQFEQLQEQMAAEFRDTLRDQFAEGVKTYIGRFEP